MKRMNGICARVVLVAAVATVSSFASGTVAAEPIAPAPVVFDPIAAGAAAAGGFFSATGEVAIVIGRTFFNILGMGIETLPPRTAGPVVPLLPLPPK